jgi:ABC-type nitrate/sulfonate/bicarbonate transport system substrate-binding protein
VNKRQFIRVLGGGVAASLLPSRRTASAQDLPVIRVASLVSDTAGEPIYGQDSGIFTRAGFRVELTLLTNYGAVQTAIVSRAVDVGVLDSMGFAVTVSHNIPLSIIAAGAQYNTKSPTLLLCVAKNSPLRRPADLAGKTIAVGTLRGSADISTRAWLEQQNVVTSGVRIIELPFAEMGAALERGTVDAATIAEPSLAAAIKAGARPFGKTYEAVAQQFVQNVWATSTEYAQQNPDVLKRFVASIYDVARWANAHHAESAAILTKYSKLDEATVREMTRTQFATSLDPKALQPVIDTASKYGVIPKDVPAVTLIAPQFRS